MCIETSKLSTLLTSRTTAAFEMEVQRGGRLHIYVSLFIQQPLVEHLLRYISVKRKACHYFIFFPVNFLAYVSFMRVELCLGHHSVLKIVLAHSKFSINIC